MDLFRQGKNADEQKWEVAGERGNEYINMQSSIAQSAKAYHRRDERAVDTDLARMVHTIPQFPVYFISYVSIMVRNVSIS